MNIVAQTAVALGRAVIIGGFAVTISESLSLWMAGQRGRARTLAWTLLVAPLFTPSLLISYTFSKVALALIVSPWSHEALYIGTLALKLAPVAVIVRVLLPAPLSQEASHLYRMCAGRSWRERVSFRLRAAGAGPWIALGLVFVLAFADFELASLWSIRTWTVAIFDAQIGGLALGETLRLAAWPLFVELAVLGLVARNLRGCQAALTDAPQNRARAPWLYLGMSATLVCLLPLGVVCGQAIKGFAVIGKSFVLGSEIGASVLFALGAAVAAALLARLGRKSSAITVALTAPGLLGALVVSLLVLTLFQAPMARAIYDTPLPLLLALTITLLPLAILLRALWSRRMSALHVADQVGSQRLIWELKTRPHAAALGLLFCWAYFDFTASSILAPVGLTPVFVRLHNLAHYGQTAVLSAMMLAAFVVPVLAVLMAGAAARICIGKRD